MMDLPIKQLAAIRRNRVLIEASLASDEHKRAMCAELDRQERALFEAIPALKTTVDSKPPKSA